MKYELPKNGRNGEFDTLKLAQKLEFENFQKSKFDPNVKFEPFKIGQNGDNHTLKLVKINKDLNSNLTPSKFVKIHFFEIGKIKIWEIKNLSKWVS